MSEPVAVTEWVNETFSRFGASPLVKVCYASPKKVRTHAEDFLTTANLGGWPRPLREFRAAENTEQVIQALYSAFTARGRRGLRTQACERLFALWLLWQDERKEEFALATTTWRLYQLLESEDETVSLYLELMEDVRKELGKLAPVKPKKKVV